MRKYLIVVLMVILLILSYVLIMDGIQIKDFKILSIQEIMQEDENLDLDIRKVTEMANKNYPNEKDLLNENVRQLTLQKEKYTNLFLFTTDEEVSSASQIKKYEMETIWVTAGNYATKNKLTMKLDVIYSTSGTKDMYDLNFTLIGSYISIIDCISQIENDSTLGFRIEDFKMIPDLDNNLKATFTVKNISINIDSITESNTVDTNNGNTTNNTNDTNTKDNTANSNNSVNSTNKVGG